MFGMRLRVHNFRKTTEQMLKAIQLKNDLKYVCRMAVEISEVTEWKNGNVCLCFYCDTTTWSYLRYYNASMFFTCPFFLVWGGGRGMYYVRITSALLST